MDGGSFFHSLEFKKITYESQMIAIIIFIGLIIGLNCIPLLTKRTFQKTEKAIKKILAASTILFLIFAIFEFSGYRLKGLYTFSIIIWIFNVSTIVYFAVYKNSIKKLITVFLLTPLIVLSILTLLIGQLVYENKIDKTNNISVTTGGFLACGEIIHITQTRFGIFDKDVYHINNICLIGIKKIETVKIIDFGFSNYLSTFA